ncbi:hypothetical protein ACS0TY_025961 [Phlomoides rotata]
MIEFRGCIENCGLSDLGFIGHAYTWKNKQMGLGNIQERLYRGLATKLWLSRFPNVRITHLT